jgi:peroxiredoxin
MFRFAEESMTSGRRSAQMGLCAAGLVFVLSMSVIGWGSADEQRQAVGTPGATAANFVLSNTDGTTTRLSDFRGSVVVLGFHSVACPVSTDYDARLAELTCRFGADSGVKFLAVHSGTGTTDPASAHVREISVQSRTAGLNVPLLLDPGIGTARDYGVTQTPTFFVIDTAGIIRYRGTLDDNRDPAAVTRPYLSDAIRRVRDNRLPDRSITRGAGCELR